MARANFAYGFTVMIFFALKNLRSRAWRIAKWPIEKAKRERAKYRIDYPGCYIVC